MLTIAILNIDIVGDVSKWFPDFEYSKLNFARDIANGVAIKLTENGRTCIYEEGLFDYKKSNLRKDVLIRTRTENNLYSLPDLLSDSNFDLSKLVLERYKAHNDFRKIGQEILDISVIITDLKNPDNEKMMSDIIMQLDAMGNHPDANKPQVFIFGFDLFANIISNKTDTEIETEKEDTLLLRIREISNYVNVCIDCYNETTTLEEYSDKIKSVFDKIISVDASDGLAIVCL